MKKSAITKLSIALAICCAIICGIAIAPLMVSLIFALVALICLVGSVLILFVGAFVWLFTVGQTNIFGYATGAANFGLGLFNFIVPIANFSFHYLTPIAGWVAVGFGVLGIIFASIGISKAKKAAQTAAQDELNEEPASFDGADELAEESAPFEETDELSEEPSDAIIDEPVSDKKKKKKKKIKTEKGACVAALAVSIVFTVVALIAILVAFVAVTFF